MDESNRFFMADVTPVSVEKAINSMNAEIHPGLMKFWAEHLHDLIGVKGGHRHGQEFLKCYTNSSALYLREINCQTHTINSLALVSQYSSLKWPATSDQKPEKSMENAFHLHFQRILKRTRQTRDKSA